MPQRDTSIAILQQDISINPKLWGQSGALNSTQGHKPSYTIWYYEKNSVSKKPRLSGISKHGCTHNIFTL